jgi:DNA invertase Pin-like site-specific DNA recombinase
MSTDQQKYSTANQAATNHAYAALRGMEIVNTFVDLGRSGLSLKRRNALKQLIETVESGSADFKVILVYDVSRWGRFQDADESAHLEYICKRAGIAVHYCAEQFENDGSPTAGQHVRNEGGRPRRPRPDIGSIPDGAQCFVLMSAKPR